MKDYYHILGISKDATQEQIEEAYRKLAKKYHPDLNKGDQFFENMFIEINEANEILSDLLLRQEYDKTMSSKTTNDSDYDESNTTGKSSSESDEQQLKGLIDEYILVEKLSESSLDILKREKKKPKPSSSYLIISILITIAVLLAYYAFILKGNPRLIYDNYDSVSSEYNWVTTEKHHVYIKPDLKSTKIGEIDKGYEFNSISETKYFIKVKFKDDSDDYQEGYLRKTHLKELE